MNFFNEINETSRNITLLIELNRTNIENLIILIGTIPFVKNNSIFLYHVKNVKTYEIIKKILRNKTISNKNIIMTEKDFQLIKKNIIKFLNYKWELIPNQNILNIIRFALNNYYNEVDFQLFDKILNINFKYYINSNILSIDAITSLMSKFYS